MCCQKSGITPGGRAKIAIMMLNTTPLAMAIIITNIFLLDLSIIISYRIIVDRDDGSNAV